MTVAVANDCTEPRRCVASTKAQGAGPDNSVDLNLGGRLVYAKHPRVDTLRASLALPTPHLTTPHLGG